MIDYLEILRQSAALQNAQKMFGKRPGSFGSKGPQEEAPRAKSPITGKAAPATVDEAKGSTPAAKAQDKERRK